MKYLIIVMLVLFLTACNDLTNEVKTVGDLDYEIIYIEEMPCIHTKSRNGYQGYEALTCNWSKWKGE